MSNSRLILGVVGTALVGPTAFAQSWDDKVTLTTGARPAGEVISELSKATGLAMSVDGLAKNDIVFIHLKNTTVRIAAEKIAAATGSRWVEKQGTYVLERTAADERRQWDADAKLRTDEITSARQATRQQLVEASQRDAGTRSRLAPQLVCHRILEMIPAEQIAAMEPGGRLVFASKTTSMQKRLPSGALNIARELITSQIEVQQAQLDRIRNAAQDRNQGANRVVDGIQNEIARLRNAKIDKVYLILQSQGSSTLTTRLDLVDVQGQLLGSTNAHLELDPARRGRSQNPQSYGGGSALEFSDRAKAWANLWRQSGRTGSSSAQIFTSNITLVEGVATFDLGEAEAETRENVEAAVRSLAAKPDENEPLDFYVSELLRLAAEAENAGVVACIPDAAMQPAAQAVLGSASAKGLWQNIANLQMAAKLEDGLYVVSPQFQSRSRYERMNRSAAAKLVEDARKGYASLEDLGKYALASSRGAFAGPLDIRLVSLAHPEAGSALRRNGANQEALAVYVALGPTRRKEMMSQRTTVPLTAINARDEVAWLTYNSFDGPMLRSNQGRNQRQNNAVQIANQLQFLSEVPVLGGQFSTALAQITGYQERTDMLPNGLPASTLISLSGQVSTTLRASENLDQTGRTAMLSPESLGAHRAQRDSPAFADNRNNMADYRAFTMAQSGNYVITITYADNYTLTRSLQEVQIDANARPLGMGDLDPEIRRRIDDAYTRTYNSMKNIRVGGGDRRNQRTPPP